MAETETVRNDFSKGPMWQVILKMSVPMMLAQLVNALYNMHIGTGCKYSRLMTIDSITLSLGQANCMTTLIVKQ